MTVKRFFNKISAVWLIPVILAAVIIFAVAVSDLESDSGEENRKQLENSLRRAAVTCYALEGIYPPDIKYLQDHYGVQVDEESFAVFYEIFAENLMPEITVVKLK